MSLTKITDLTERIGLSSRTLRYYEEIGLVISVRLQYEKYRYYDEENIERLKQIIVLRKMQIPIKDIVKIYESEDMRTLVDVFVAKINEIDNEVTELSELKNIVNEFLQKMIAKGVKKISALPLIYEEMDKQLEVRENINFDKLSHVSEKLSKPLDISIIDLPPMQVLSSYFKDNNISDTDEFSKFLQMNNLKIEFEYQDKVDVMIAKIPNDFINNSKFSDFYFDGGLFAVVNIYLDDDLGLAFKSLIKSFDDNKYYQIDYKSDGNLRHNAMIKNLISPDEQRRLLALYVPVKKRIPDVSLYPKPNEITDITIKEIEKQNPILWSKAVALDKMTPINNPHYKVLDGGEIEYVSWISTRVLGTNISVRLPFRIDIEVKMPMDDMAFGYGDSEGGVLFYHGDKSGYANGDNLDIMKFGVNLNNHASDMEQAISFHQPIFHDYYTFRNRGKIVPNEYNKITWIIGQNHLAVIINDEIRYCGENFPYMSLNLNNEEYYPVIIGSNGQGKKYFRNITVSQLVTQNKNKIKNGELTMITKQSNNIISVIHRLITNEYGENYWFNGCARYVMECLGEYTKDADLMTDDIFNLRVKDNNLGFWLFAGLTGDIFTQHYKQPFMGDGVNAHYQDQGDGAFFEAVFAKCGYAATFVFSRDLCKNKEMYVGTLISYIDKGIPVISMGHDGPPFGVFVGYEEHGKTLLYITGNDNEPKRVSADEAMESKSPNISGWIFVGEKKENIPVQKIYRDAILALPKILTTNDDKYCFGAAAFRKWADDIERGIFDNMKPDEFEGWSMYTNFVCVLATNGSCAHNFLKRAMVHLPDMPFLDDIDKLYTRMGQMWNNDNGKDLEALGGGFNITLEVLQDKEKRAKIANKIREFAVVTDEIVDVLNSGIKMLPSSSHE